MATLQKAAIFFQYLIQIAKSSGIVESICNENKYLLAASRHISKYYLQNGHDEPGILIFLHDLDLKDQHRIRWDSHAAAMPAIS